MLLSITLALVLNAAKLPYRELEKYYWDCDTLFMRGNMSGQDLQSCLSITDEFQKKFKTKEDFMIYWHEHRLHQWGSRGYYPRAEMY